METKRICVFGVVQGVGFRPFVSRLAKAHGLVGTVCNRGSYVEIFVQGTAAQVQAFRQDLPGKAPARSTILKIHEETVERDPFTTFSIVESAKEKGNIFVSPDIAVCDTCKEELFDKANRRYLHPFINCTACGPRLTILDSMPYDRERTSMGEFPMCPQCEYEYTHAETRRYDAQPVCCNDCGPEVYLLDRPEKGADAITAARQILHDGGIVAVKGIGGFHLCCDGTNEEAVGRLRKLKHRPMKPLAVMMKDMAVVRTYCTITEAEEVVLDGHQKPIILLPKKEGNRLAPSVSPHNPSVGVMLPYAPLQLLLFTYPDGIDMPDCLVMTSANPSGAPICRTDDDVRENILPLCDAVLSHNRQIRLRADDSVMAFYDDEPYMIRRSRGYAPLPFFVGAYEKTQVLGLGGELKNAFCLSQDNLFYLSPYIGDMADVRTVTALRESIERLETLLEIQPDVVVCDLHPRYNTTAVAQDLGLPVRQIQHHYGHVLSCMAENEYLEPVIGVSFDGTGYGTDGTIWGGEILLANTRDFTRFASLMPFTQSGGDASSREGWRIAVSLLYDATGRNVDETKRIIAELGLCTPQEGAMQLFMMEKGINSVPSTSAGRLFDGISAILGLCKKSTFEGEGAMELQFAAERCVCPDVVRWDTEPLIERDGLRRLPTDRLVKTLWQRYRQGADVTTLAYAFHQALASYILTACDEARRETGIETVALTGGVFQNLLLLRLCDEGLTRKGFTVLRHHLVPPNDGGLALGQALWGAANFHR